MSFFENRSEWWSMNLGTVVMLWLFLEFIAKILRNIIQECVVNQRVFCYLAPELCAALAISLSMKDLY